MKNIFLTFVLFFPIFLFSQIIKAGVEPQIEADKETLDYQLVEEIPVFPGCENIEKEAMQKCFNDKIRNHIITHFDYPYEAVELEIEGRINVSFVINKDGDVANIEAKGGNSILVNAAKKIFLTLPKMKPGMIKGKPVNISYVFPISFKLQ